MPLWLEKRYANIVSVKLEQFKWKKPTLANFRCPFCGDSQKNKRKARGYLYTKNGNMFYKCHNCPESTNFSGFLKFVDANLYDEYRMEDFAERMGARIGAEEVANDCVISAEAIAEEEEMQSLYFPIKNATQISLLPVDHYARVYLDNRKIPTSFYSELLYTDNMSEFVKLLEPDKEAPPEPHILITIRDEFGRITGFNGRSMKPESKFSKYTKTKISDNVKMIFGLDRVKRDLPIFVFEGEFDSMFIPNGISAGGIALMNGIEISLGVNKENITCVVDNDPRNKDVVRSIDRLLESGYKVVLFPDNIAGKDVNELVRDHKLETDQILKLINENTYSGLEGILKVIEWRRC